MSRFTLLCCVLIHVQVVTGNWWMIYTFLNDSGVPSVIIISVPMGIMYLLYPVCDWLTELVFSNYCMIKWSFNTYVFSSVTILCFPLVSLFWHNLENTTILFSVAGLAGVSSVIGLGMFESIAIQFGMDQMLEASSDQLSSFINWYFLCVNVGGLMSFYFVLGVIVFTANCQIRMDSLVFDMINDLFSGTTLIFGCVQIVLSLVGIFAIKYYSKYYYIERTSRNPFKLVFKVLQYSYHHKYPERRSAFTYWEAGLPSRINLGMSKYGGPFTYEQVEDVKTTFGLLMLMGCLFGFHVSGDGFSMSSYVVDKIGCPQLVELFVLFLNPNHLPMILVIIAVPFFKKINQYRFCNPQTLLQRMQIGLFLCLVNEAFQGISSIFLQLQTRSEYCENMNMPLLYKPFSCSGRCLFSSFRVMTASNCTYLFPMYVQTTINITELPLVVVNQLLHGICYVMVFLSMVEFICAQSPNEMKGLLIGIWYSMLSIKSFIVHILDNFIIADGSWNTYHGVKGIIIFVSVVLFSLGSRKYRYRQRNEIVNQQAMIEEQYERELLLNTENYSSEN